MIGKRVDPVVEPHNYRPGDYGHCAGVWYGCSPNGHLANLANHAVIEHQDRTITVSPSILITTGAETVYHGFLRAGEWHGV